MDEPTKNNSALIHLQAAINLIPYAGGFLSTYVGEYREKRAQKRVDYYINQLSNSISCIEQDKLDKEYLESEEFAELFLRGVEQSSKTVSEKRIKKFANILANSAISDSRARERAQSIMGLIDSISDMDAFVLACYGNNFDICFNPNTNEELHELVTALSKYLGISEPLKEQTIYSAVFMDNLGLTWVNQKDLGDPEDAGRDILFKEFSSFRTPLGEEVISVTVPPDFFIPGQKNIKENWPEKIVNSKYCKEK